MALSSVETTRSAATTRPRAWGSRLRGLVYWALVLALVGVNAWWLLREAQPLPELKTVSDWAREQHHGEAEAALREHLRRSPHNGEARVMLARIRAGQGDKLGAARLVHDVPEWWPGKPEMRSLEGQLFLDVGRARDAEATWKRCFDANGGAQVTAHARARAKAALALIKLYLQQNRKDEARALVWRAYETADPADREDLLQVRMETELLTEPAQIRAERLQRYADADPADWQSRRALALEKQALGRQQDALALIDQCLRAQPDALIVRRDLLFLLREQGNQNRFREELARLPEKAGNDALLCKFQGLAREQDGDLDAARTLFQRAAELGSADTETFYHLGLVERRLGHPKEAAAAIARSQRIHDANLKFYPAFWDYLQASKATHDRDTLRARAITRLAALCRELGWEREADAWLMLIRSP